MMRSLCLFLFAVVSLSALSQPTTPHTQCPVETIRVLPRVFTVRVYAAQEDGWRPASRMTFDLRLKNGGSQEIAALSFAFKFPGSTVPDRAWKNAPASIAGGVERTLYYDGLIDFGAATSTTVVLTKIKFADGEIYDADCPLGTLPIPPPVKPGKVTSPSQVSPAGAELSPPRIVKSQLFDSGILGVARNVQTVTLSVLVEIDGLPRDIKIESGSMGLDLDGKAIEALGKWEFTPAMIGDKLVATRIPVQFTIGQ